MDWENHLEKNQSKKLKKLKTKLKLPHVNKKPLPRERTLVQTPFSNSTLNLDRKNYTPQNHSLLCSISCCDVIKITTPY